MTTFTWEYGSAASGLQFTITYDDTTSQFTVESLVGSFDLNALWVSDGNSTADPYPPLAKVDKDLNMNGSNTVWDDGTSSTQAFVWDDYGKLSSAGLGSAGQNKVSFISSGETHTFALSDFVGLSPFDPTTFDTLGVRATSVNGNQTIKWVDATPEIDEGPGGGTSARIVYSAPGANDLDVLAFTFVAPAADGVLYQVTNTPVDEMLNDFTATSGSLGTLGPVPLAPVLTGTFQVVNAGPGDQTDPHVYLNLASYTSTDNNLGTSEIRYFDFFTNEDHLVPTTGPAFLSDVDAGRIVYTQLSGTGSEIGVYNTADTTTFIIPGGTQQRLDPSIGSTTVAWEDRSFSANPAESEIVVYDLATNTTTRLTNDALRDFNPEVSADGQVVVFQKAATTGVNSDIYVSVQTSPGVFTTSALTGSPGEDIHPTTNGSLVAWASDVDGDFDIYFAAVGGGAATHLDLPGEQRNPSFAGDMIAFESNEVGAQFDIYVYDTGGDVII